MRAMIMTNRPADLVNGKQGRVKTYNKLLAFDVEPFRSTGNMVELKLGLLNFNFPLCLKSMGNMVELK
jgi:hypothetical protein